MKKVIIVLVVLVHLGLIYWLFFAESHKPAPAVADVKSETAKPANPATPAAPTPAEAPLAVEQTLDAMNFTYATAAVSSALAKQTTDCTAGVLIDVASRQILWHKNEHQPVPIASMTKMMTTLMLMDAIHRDKRVTLETVVPISAATAKIGGSQVYLDPKETFTVDELLKCIMIKSANDAAYQIGEFLGGGSADKFVMDMNQRAQELGMRHTKFYNSHGLPPGPKMDENQASAMEMAYLGLRLLDYPDVVKWSGKFIDYIRVNDPKKKFELVNHNKLVATCPGVNGMKTGFTAKSKYCITATCTRGGRVLVCVVSGCPSSKQRNALVESLLNWGYAVAGRTASAAATPAQVPPAAAVKPAAAAAPHKAAH